MAKIMQDNSTERGGSYRRENSKLSHLTDDEVSNVIVLEQILD